MSDTSRTDYKDSVFLPETSFPMRGELPKREPALLARWKDMDLFGKLRARAAGWPKFVLHDGPPYANGNLHIGHALNKILKDVINRVHQMKGEDANYVPGWDCHGLPIEWKIEEEYRAKGKDKDAVPIVEFRRECRDFAAKWIDIQRAEFKRLGVEGDWSNPYATMTFPAEAHIVREIHRFALNGGLYRGARPVMWSVVEKTALAEAEIEYHEHKSDTVWVRFPITTTADFRDSLSDTQDFNGFPLQVTYLLNVKKLGEVSATVGNESIKAVNMTLSLTVKGTILGQEVVNATITQNAQYAPSIGAFVLNAANEQTLTAGNVIDGFMQKLMSYSLK